MLADDWRERFRFYQELGVQTFYRRRTAPSVPPLGGEDTRVPTTSEPSGGQVRATVGAPRDLFEAVTPRETLEEVRADLGECTRCKLHRGRSTIVFGSGNPKAEVVFVGEGPGADEDAQGLPFVGRAGRLLTEMINNSAARMKVPLQREHTYICNIIKCRPPNNRTPEREEVETCSPFLLRQLDAIRPRAIVALGATAVRFLLNNNESMARLRGRWFEYRGAQLLVTYHPAYLLRDPSKKREAWDDMQTLLRFLYGKR